MFKTKAGIQRELKLPACVFLIALTLLQVVSFAFAENGNDDVEDLAQKFGWVGVGLFSLTLFYIIFYQLFIKSRKILPKNDKFENRVNNIKKVYLKVKKPFSFLHYFAATTAIIILLFHGIPFLGNEAEKVIPGLVAGTTYLIYLVLGILIKVVLRKSKKGMKLRRYLFKFHTNLIMLIIIGGITITHIAISA